MKKVILPRGLIWVCTFSQTYKFQFVEILRLQHRSMRIFQPLDFKTNSAHFDQACAIFIGSKDSAYICLVILFLFLYSIFPQDANILKLELTAMARYEISAQFCQVLKMFSTLKQPA